MRLILLHVGKLPEKKTARKGARGTVTTGRLRPAARALPTRNLWRNTPLLPLIRRREFSWELFCLGDVSLEEEARERVSSTNLYVSPGKAFSSFLFSFHG